jgi:DNA-binding MarR family transcriptional regulator
MNTTNNDIKTIAKNLVLALSHIRARLRIESGATQSKFTTAQGSALIRIIDNAPITVKDLAAIEHVRPQSMAETVSELRAQGFIKSELSPFDRRKVLLGPTAKGKKRIATAYSFQGAWLSKVMTKRLTQDELDIVMKATKILEQLADYKNEQR